MLEMQSVLALWLGSIPPLLVLFANLSIIEALLHALSLPLTTAARAPGRMRTYELSLGIVQILIFVATLIAFHFGAAAYSMYVVSIIANALLFVLRLYIVQNLIGLSMSQFLKYVVSPCLVVVFCSASPSIALKSLLPTGPLYTILIILCSFLINGICIYFLGLDKQWRLRVRQLLIQKTKKVMP